MKEPQKTLETEMTIQAYRVPRAITSAGAARIAAEFQNCFELACYESVSKNPDLKGDTYPSLECIAALGRIVGGHLDRPPTAAEAAMNRAINRAAAATAAAEAEAAAAKAAEDAAAATETAPAATAAAVLGGAFDAAKIGALIDASALDATTKTTLKAGIDAAGADAAAQATAVAAVKAALGM